MLHICYVVLQCPLIPFGSCIVHVSFACSPALFCSVREQLPVDVLEYSQGPVQVLVFLVCALCILCSAEQDSVIELGASPTGRLIVTVIFPVVLSFVNMNHIVPEHTSYIRVIGCSATMPAALFTELPSCFQTPLTRYSFFYY